MSIAVPSRAEPMAELNTTPLIDIMLVLLVMLMFTLPPAVNSLEIPLPTHTPPIDRPVDHVRNVLTITASDKILWNDDRVNEIELDSLLRQAASLKPEPELQLIPDGRASYDESARVLRLIKLSGASKIGFVGNERYRSFTR